MEDNSSYDKLNKISIPPDLEARLEASINCWAEAEKQAKRKVKQLRICLGSIAAGIAVLIVAGWLLNTESQYKPQSTSWHPNVIEDPERAYQETQKALILVSYNFNKGLNQLAVASDKIEKSNELFIQKFNKMFKK